MPLPLITGHLAGGCLRDVKSKSVGVRRNGVSGWPFIKTFAGYLLLISTFLKPLAWLADFPLPVTSPFAFPPEECGRCYRAARSLLDGGSCRTVLSALATSAVAA